jgi:hypothetical protein
VTIASDDGQPTRRWKDAAMRIDVPKATYRTKLHEVNESVGVDCRLAADSSWAATGKSVASISPTTS